MVKENKFFGVCKKCGAKCCKFGGPNFTEREIKKVLNAGYKDYSWKVRNKIYELKCKKGVCPYLKKNNSCEIQKIKPLVCLYWPIFPVFNGTKIEYYIYQCPLTKILSQKDIKKTKKEASKITKNLLDVALDYSIVPKPERRILKKRFNKFKKRKLK